MGGVYTQIQPLVQHADTVLKWSKRLLSSTVVNGVVKRTFFRHFCAGMRLLAAACDGSMWTFCLRLK